MEAMVMLIISKGMPAMPIMPKITLIGTILTVSAKNAILKERNNTKNIAPSESPRVDI
jgi:hypothetical protein